MLNVRGKSDDMRTLCARQSALVTGVPIKSVTSYNKGRMIKFPCRCGHRFAFDLEMAGGLVQCPKCSRLNDVPSLSDLKAVREDDGTIELREDEPLVEPGRVEKLKRAFGPKRVDDDGNEIDLRNTPEDLVGLDAPIPMAGDPGTTTRLPRPRYDPFTGELIRPIDVTKGRGGANDAQDGIDPKNVPVAKRALNYASGESARRVGAGSIALQLLQPINLIVMGFILLFHVYAYVAMMVTSIFVFTVVFWLAAPLMLLAHYSNVIDEIGPCDRDELPRPLRNLDWHDDLWGAFVQLTFALIVGFLPWILTIALTWNWADEADTTMILVNGIGLGLSLLITPAVVLTATTSGSISNMRPDRVMSVMNVLGARYLLLVLLGMLTFVIYGLGILGGNLPFLAYPFPVLRELKFLSYPVATGLIVVGVYFGHWFCWYMGVLYRENHAEFPWSHQQYVRQPVVRKVKRSVARER